MFVQVGANDGVGHDLLIDEVASRHWRGVLVEPVPYVFERLQANHGANPRLELDNVAIADVDGSRDLYYLDAAEPGAPLPAWYDKLGSFDRDVIAKHSPPAIPDFERRLRVEPVRCVTFDTLCRTHGLASIDLVQIDTEGYDFEIIKLIDLDRLTPRLVIYEHLHFDADTRAGSEHMEARGYEEISDVVNTVALRTSGLGPRDYRLLGPWRAVAAQVRTGLICRLLRCAAWTPPPSCPGVMRSSPSTGRGWRSTSPSPTASPRWAMRRSARRSCSSTRSCKWSPT